MKVNQDTVRKIAHLSRLAFDDASEQKMMDDMNDILSFVEKLQELDTASIKPLESMSLEVNNLREDQVQSPLSREKGLLNAPVANNEYFLVPKVLG